MAVDIPALVAGGIRFSSGVHFLADPLGANRLWGNKEEVDNTARLLLRSMGYRDFLIGAMLIQSSLRGKDTRGWFLASGGADAADLIGGLPVHHEMTGSAKVIGLGGALVGIGVGLWGGVLRRRPA